MTFMNSYSCIAAVLHQCMIKLRTWGNGSKDTTNVWQGKFNCPASRGVHNNVRADLPIGNTAWVKAKLVKDSQCICGEPIAATLVSWERGFVHHCHVVTEAMKGGGTGSS